MKSTSGARAGTAFFNFLLTCFSVVACLVVLDIALRTFSVSAPRSGVLSPKASVKYLTETTIVFQPGYSGTLKGREFEVSVRSNSEGFRDREVDFSGQAPGRPYLFTGDSYFFGWGVDASQRVSERVVAILKGESHALDGPSFNFAFPGFGTFQYLDVLKMYTARLRPRAVIVGFFVGNDFIDDRNTSVVMRERGSAAGESPLVKYLGEEAFSLRSVLRTSPLVNMVRYELWKFAWFRKIFNRMEIRNDRLDLYRTDGDQRQAEYYGRTFGVFDNIAAYCRAERVPILVVIIPDHLQVLTKDLFAGYEIGRPQRLLAKHLKDVGIPYLDLLDHFSKAGNPQDLFFRQDKHWNARGHEFVARAIAEYLVKEQDSFFTQSESR